MGQKPNRLVDEGESDWRYRIWGLWLSRAVACSGEVGRKLCLVAAAAPLSPLAAL